MTGFARTNGNISLSSHNISWIWEIKSVNGKSLDLKYRLPTGFEDISLLLKNKLLNESLSLEHVYDAYTSPLMDLLSDNKKNDPLENIVKEIEAKNE